MKDDCCLFVRARKPQEVAQRRESILAAMAGLLHEAKPEQISLNEVARRAGLAKSNLYRYFDSREAILLELLREDSQRWIAQIEVAASRLDGRGDIAAVADILTTATAANVRMCQLWSHVPTVLGQDVSDATMLAFRQRHVDVVERLARAVHQALPDLPANELPHAMRHVLALVIGLWPLSAPSQTVRQPLSQEFSAVQPGFEDALKRGVTLVLRGLTSSA